MPLAVITRRFRESSGRICRQTTRMAVVRTARNADSEVHILRHAKSACQAGEQLKVRIRVPPQAGFGVRLEYSGTPVSSFRLCNVNRLNLIQLYIADVTACSLVDPCRQFKYRNRRGFEWSRSRAFTQSHHGGCSYRFTRCCATQCGLCESTGHRLPQSWRRLPGWGSSFVVVIQRASRREISSARHSASRRFGRNQPSLIPRRRHHRGCSDFAVTRSGSRQARVVDRRSADR